MEKDVVASHNSYYSGMRHRSTVFKIINEYAKVSEYIPEVASVPTYVSKLVSGLVKYGILSIAGLTSTSVWFKEKIEQQTNQGPNFLSSLLDNTRMNDYMDSAILKIIYGEDSKSASNFSPENIDDFATMSVKNELLRKVLAFSDEKVLHDIAEVVSDMTDMCEENGYHISRKAMTQALIDMRKCFVENTAIVLENSDKLLDYCVQNHITQEQFNLWLKEEQQAYTEEIAPKITLISQDLADIDSSGSEYSEEDSNDDVEDIEEIGKEYLSRRP